jgi:squalene synthase HpnC
MLRRTRHASSSSSATSRKSHSLSFADDLTRFGPDAPLRVSREEALAYCAHLAATHYENFSVVTWLTPREYRPAFQSIYAFCRWSDDLGDEVGNPARALELLKWWRGELKALSEGHARHPVMIALADTIARYSIPIEPFEALISAFEQDQRVTEYETFEQLLDYCTRSANPVGHLVLHVAGAFTPKRACLADFTCTALQLANFWQDVAPDLAIGRIYLPREDRMRFACAENDLRALRFTPEFAALVQFEVERTRALFEAGRPLASEMDGPIGLSIDLFSRGGLAVLDRIQARRFDVLSARPALTRRTKVFLVARALVSRVGRIARPSPGSRAVGRSLACTEDST